MGENGYRRTISVNWDGLDDADDDDNFFESCDRMSSAAAAHLVSAGSDDDDEDDDDAFDDPRMSFSSAISSSGEEAVDFRCISGIGASTSSDLAETDAASHEEYNIWLADPGSINERRKRLFHGMGFGLSNKEFLRLASAEIQRAVSKKIGANCQVSPMIIEESSSSLPMPPKAEASSEKAAEPPDSSTGHPQQVTLTRSRSDGYIDFLDIAERKEEFFGATSKKRLTRRASDVIVPVAARTCRHPDSVRVSPKRAGARSTIGGHKGGGLSSVLSTRFGAIFLIKNLDTGKEFIVNEYDKQGMWNRLSDLQTGKQLTMEEFEKSVGYSPVVKELMSREKNARMANGGEAGGTLDRKSIANTYLSKSLRMSKKSGVALLKNIKGVANSVSGLMGESQTQAQAQTQNQVQAQAQTPVHDAKPPTAPSSDEWVRVRQCGKSYKELSALKLCQEIQAHEGSIWTIRFSLDAQYLASAGEDGVIHVWEVQGSELMSLRPDEWSLTPLHPSAGGGLPDRFEGSPAGSLSPAPSDKKKKGIKGPQNNGGKKGLPDYVSVPELVFGLSERPVCTFKGHSDDVLDLSWSGSQLLLSSSMDKTVRLWDTDTKNCLKLFAHNDYVTCIQFNPMDDRYFISGSLDSKVRIWSIPDRQVVDWTDVHEMITAVCYTPDGQGAIIGSNKGSCRIYSTEDCKLNQTSQMDVANKKKSQAKKITGLQFSPSNPSEVLITSADSRVRIAEGADITQKFIGFRNTSSQIAASFTQDGKYIVSASEDSNVYVWKHQEAHNGKSKSAVNIQSYESFQCKDVSMAIPWPGSIRAEPPRHMGTQSKRQSKRCSAPPSPSRSVESPTREENAGASIASKRQLPPLPKKPNAVEKTATPPPEEETGAQLSRVDSGAEIGESFGSASARYGSDSPSISSATNPSSSSWSSSWSWFDGGSSNGAMQGTAWGMVIVTAGLGGEIRAYQNFGLPRKVGPNLFSST
ncbi:hypothetical protein SAY86_015103 [Trapa natans]|uniref:WD repeat-containing protein 44 n=1 Tax=Trapa natans TaxID=22666 RepID=A0AAN7KE64_TRANT|nr:hypothetical protein SAY86_015103 [Trapa natans]